MATETSYLGLKKAEEQDFYNVNEINANWDKVDTEAAETASEVAAIHAEMDRKAAGNPETGAALSAERLGGPEGLTAEQINASLINKADSSGGMSMLY